jgi:PadR family transcriptional regulator, regulatory protein PadR
MPSTCQRPSLEANSDRCAIQVPPAWTKLCAPNLIPYVGFLFRCYSDPYKRARFSSSAPPRTEHPQCPKSLDLVHLWAAGGSPPQGDGSYFNPSAEKPRQYGNADPRWGSPRNTISPLHFYSRGYTTHVEAEGEKMTDRHIDLPQGTLDLLILRALAPGPQHGWAISERVQQVSSDVLKIQQGSLYPALHRLERRGWIKAQWGTSENNRRAKYYELTRSGKKQLEVEMDSWQKLTAAVAQVLESV